MSAGSRSGVSWTRWNFAEIAFASVVAVSVLATPGTPSSRRWPQPERAPLRPRERDRGEERRQHAPHQRVLADDHFRDLLLEPGHDVAGRLGVQCLVFHHL